MTGSRSPKLPSLLGSGSYLANLEASFSLVFSQDSKMPFCPLGPVAVPF
jgi:hypothetical protein